MGCRQSGESGEQSPNFLKGLCELLLEDWKAKATPKFPFNLSGGFSIQKQYRLSLYRAGNLLQKRPTLSHPTPLPLGGNGKEILGWLRAVSPRPWRHHARECVHGSIESPRAPRVAS